VIVIRIKYLGRNMCALQPMNYVVDNQG
jgi:hypothetical protein